MAKKAEKIAKKTIKKRVSVKSVPKSAKVKSPKKTAARKVIRKTAIRKPARSTTARKRPAKSKITDLDNLKLPAPEESEPIEIKVRRRLKKKTLVDKLSVQRPNPQPSYRLPWLHHKRLVWKSVGFIAFFSLAGTYLVLTRLSSPAEGTIITKQSPGAAAQTTQLTTRVFDGKYISFSYLGNYEQISKKLSGSFLEVVGLSTKGLSSRTINISVVRGSIADNSGVAFRQSKPEDYKETAITGGLAFVSTKTGYERTVFLAHAGLVASISLTATGNQDYQSDSDQVVKTLTWK